MTRFNTPAEAAAAYIAAGFAVIPVPYRKKGAVLDGWPALRLAAGDIPEHFPHGAARNIGVLNGEPSGGLLDLDLDCIEAVRAAPLLLPPTKAVFGRAGRPRSHWLYRSAPALDGASKEFPGLEGGMLLEMRGTGGQTVFPPSRHEDTGDEIRWEEWGEPAPLALGDLRRAAHELAAAALFARHWPSKGGRNKAALALSGGLTRAGWNEDKVEQFIKAVCVAAGDEESSARARVAGPTAAKVADNEKTTGLPALAKLLGPRGWDVISQAMAWLGLGKRDGATAKTAQMVPPYTPFPVGALPEALADFVRPVARAVGVDPAMAALPALAVCAAAIGNSRAVQLKKGWSEPCGLWVVTVARSGQRKSPPLKLALAPLLVIEKAALDTYDAAVAEYKAAKAAKDGGEKVDEPESPRRHLTADTTVESLGKNLSSSPKGMLVANDELDGWFQGFVRYKGAGGGNDRNKWLELSSAGTLVVDRVNRGSVVVPRALVSVCGTIQMPILRRNLDRESREAGLGARLLVAMPDSQKRVWTDDEVEDKVLEDYSRLVGSLVSLELKDESKRLPHFLGLSPGAKKLFIAFVNELGEEAHGAGGERESVLAKIEGAAARLALVHHVVTTAGGNSLSPVTEESMRAGITLAKWFAAEWLRLQIVLGQSEDADELNTLVEIIRKHGGRITVRDLHRAKRRTYPTAAEVKAVLGRLVEAGWARWVGDGSGRKGGLATDAVELLEGGGDTGDTGDTDAGPTDAPDDSAGDSGTEENGHGDHHATPNQPTGKGLHRERPADSGAGVTGVTAPHDGDGLEMPAQPAATPTAGVTEPTYRLVSDVAGLGAVIVAIGDSSLVAMDTETTGLDHATDRVRLLSLACQTVDGGTFVYLVDCLAVDPSPLWEALDGKDIVLHNALFDLPFLARLGFAPSGRVRDTMILAQLLAAGTHDKVNLAAACERHLDRAVDKGLQKSDWSGTLTGGQLEYAARDAGVLFPLLAALDAGIRGAGLGRAAEAEEGASPAVAWMAAAGVGIDAERWRGLARAAAEEAARLRDELDAAAPRKAGDLFGGSWDWGSPAQALDALRAAGCAIEGTSDEALAAANHPLAELLRKHRGAAKQAASFGEAWLDRVKADGRVYPSWKQIGAASGRMACRGPNMQQLPRGEHRRCVAAPPGRVLVKADYSQIELRIAAKLTGDKAMLEAYRRGEDIHERTAREVLGVTEVTKQDRQMAKALNFGLLFGMGANGFRQYAQANYGIDMDEAQARRLRSAFFKAYPGLAAWHRRTGAGGDAPAETRTLAGRRRRDVKSFMEKLNTPVQGTGADGLKMTLALLWERRGEVPGAFPVLAVHDEIVVECGEAQADAAAAWLKAAMTEAMAPLIGPVPVAVEVSAGRTWGG